MTIFELRDLIAESLKELGICLVKASFEGRDNSKRLQVLIEKMDGSSVSIDECVVVSRRLAAAFSGIEFADRFSLEVSSAGIDRPLVKRADYDRFLGESVVVSLSRAVGDKKKLYAVLKSATDDGIELLVDGSGVMIGWDNIKSCRLDAKIRIQGKV
ncbi:ribosome maturation factor RimP [Candidatus Hydrogenosomobacter endosymbioticus]|uniref:Ribosome maturation factor RimP n=1 Tax=Candidatus Hydrogenosomobacter endosymbioticus TaxID=2558174 RepID=A0ABM7V927_9PROT|nr:hypothetical protein [Candidatus Hydrogenosomobacter endosymbioticus]BDB96274.1 hypothetical protein HYD_4070 [Candidatus Hydrogenosomobacter endosymbioticus]